MSYYYQGDCFLHYTSDDNTKPSHKINSEEKCKDPICWGIIDLNVLDSHTSQNKGSKPISNIYIHLQRNQIFIQLVLLVILLKLLLKPVKPLQTPMMRFK